MTSIPSAIRFAALLCTVFAFAVAVGAEPAPEPPPANAEAMKKLQGVWEIVSVEHDGVPLDAKADATHVVVEKKSLVIKGVSRREPYTFELNASVTPTRMDMSFDEPKSKPGLGIFKFEAGMLIIMSAEPGKPRPTKFDVKVGTKFVLRRPKAAK